MTYSPLIIIFPPVGAQEKINSHYQPRLKKYDETFKILDWETQETQHARFNVLIDNLPLEGKSLLDVGCGCGDLLSVLKGRGISLEYSGVDILPGMIEKARSLHPDGRFFCGDLFSSTFFFKERFAVVFVSGVFNLNLGNNAAFFDAALPVLHDYAKEALVINLLDETSPHRDDKYFYFNADEARSKMEVLGRRVRLIDGYLNNDFTLIGR